MIWAGSPFAHLVEFSTGQPTGAVSYELLGNNGVALLTTTATPAADAVSLLLNIPATHNSCALPLFENRTLTWNYMTAQGLVSGRIAYRVQRPIPFAASGDGVRSKLGIEAHELKDDEIDLVTAYAELLEMGNPSVHTQSGDRDGLLCIHAIEAIAALLVLPSLQLKLAQRETGGTNEYQRYGKVDWQRIEMELQSHVARARALLDATYDATGGAVFSFGKVTPAPDIITAV